MAKRLDPDQMKQNAFVLSGSVWFAQACLSQILRVSMEYVQMMSSSHAKIIKLGHVVQVLRVMTLGKKHYKRCGGIYGISFWDFLVSHNTKNRILL